MDWLYSFYDWPFVYRFLLLVFLMAVVAIGDLMRRGQKATKWREYGFVLAGGAIAGVFGVLNDVITSSISPEYFIFGKGLGSGEGLEMRILMLGVQAGLYAGMVGTGIYLFVNTRKTAVVPLSYPGLLRQMARPVAAAMIGGLSAFCLSLLDPLANPSSWRMTLEAAKAARFVMVWWTHSGVYTGYILGVIWGIIEIRRQTRGTGT